MAESGGPPDTINSITYTYLSARVGVEKWRNGGCAANGGNGGANSHCKLIKPPLTVSAGVGAANGGNEEAPTVTIN
jgi:hypothetical protein